MNLPTLIKSIYGEIALTGLYSFEFVDPHRNTIIEIFFMLPPTGKSMEESTRSSTIPTLGSNYNLDAGNATKPLTLSGNLWFPYVGSPDNPVAAFSDGLENTIDGLNEFFKLQWMLIRYRDYVMTKNSKVSVPTSVLNLSSEATILFKEINRRIVTKVSALYDQVKLIVHDYDFDDHYFCRVDTFSSNIEADDHLTMNYTIQLELYERDTLSTTAISTQVKKSLNEEVEITVTNINDINYSVIFDSIQDEISSISDVYAFATVINQDVDNIIVENINIQSGKNTPFDNLPTILSRLLGNVILALIAFLNAYIPALDRTDFDNGDLTLDDFVSIDLLNFYNAQQQIATFGEGMNGILNSIPRENEIRYYANADDYTLTQEQFDELNKQAIVNDSTFIYYVVKQGDTLRRIAQKIYGNSEKYTRIAQTNNISNNDIIDNNLIGAILKIPIQVSSIARGDDNLVFEGVIDPNDVNIFLHGKDILLEDGKMLISKTGDIRIVQGKTNVLQNLENRLSGRKGGLNTFQPNWGLISPDDSNSPFLVKIDRYLTDVQTQLLSDPRVESVKVDLDTLEIDGEAISFSNDIEIIGSDTKLEVQVG